jgi:hypothetical protein
LLFPQTESYITVKGESPAGFKDAKLDAVSELAERIGSMDVIKVTNFLYHQGGATALESRNEDLQITNRLISVLPPLSTLRTYRQGDLYCCEIQVREQDLERLRDMMAVISFFPYEIISRYPSIEAFYNQEILQVVTLGAPEIASVLEKEFLRLRAHIVDSRIFLYPRSLYEAELIQFLRSHCLNLSRQSNRIVLFNPDRDFFSQLLASGPDVRLMRIASDVPMPELNAILRWNGVNPVYMPGKERFSLSAVFRENSKRYATSFQAEIMITDTKTAEVLARRIFTSSAYANHVADQILSLLQGEIVNYIEDILPSVLNHY